MENHCVVTLSLLTGLDQWNPGATLLVFFFFYFVWNAISIFERNTCNICLSLRRAKYESCGRATSKKRLDAHLMVHRADNLNLKTRCYVPQCFP